MTEYAPLTKEEREALIKHILACGEETWVDRYFYRFEVTVAALEAENECLRKMAEVGEAVEAMRLALRELEIIAYEGFDPNRYGAHIRARMALEIALRAAKGEKSCQG